MPQSRCALVFLHALRALVRRFCAVCCISIPSGWLPPSFVKLVEHVCDVIVQLRSFIGSGEFADFDGTITFDKFARLNSLVAHNMDSSSQAYVFKVTCSICCEHHSNPDCLSCGIGGS